MTNTSKAVSTKTLIAYGGYPLREKVPETIKGILSNDFYEESNLNVLI